MVDLEIGLIGATGLCERIQDCQWLPVTRALHTFNRAVFERLKGSKTPGQRRMGDTRIGLLSLLSVKDIETHIQ